MSNIFSFSGQTTTNLKNKTNSSGLYRYSRKEINKSMTDERLDKNFELSINHNNQQQKLWYGMSSSNNKLTHKTSDPNIIPQDMIHHPVSPNSKRLQKLQLFRFDDKIQEIQSHQIQQLINQQMKASKDKQLQKISQLLNKSPAHPNNSNACRLFKRSSNRISKGISTRKNPNLRYGNITSQAHQLLNNKIGFFVTKNETTKNPNQSIDNKETKSVIINQKKPNQGDLQNSEIQKNFKHTAPLPLWQQNLFYQKIFSRLNQSKQPINKAYFSSTCQNPEFFNPSPKRKTESPQKLSQIQQSLNFFKNKSFSIKKNYEFYISKLNSSNPQIQQQLIDELKKSKLNERLLFDSNCKSFSGYCKIKSYMYNKEGAQEKMKAEMMRQGNQSSDELYRNVTNITSYKFSNIKPLKIRLSKKKQLLLFDGPSEPKMRRQKQNQNQEESQNQQEQSDYGIQPKFRELYKDKHDYREIEKYIADREKISRQASSPYHDLSAWN